MFIFIMENAWAGCKQREAVKIMLYRTFVMMSLEYGLSSALKAVGFVRMLKVCFQEIGI